MKKRVKAAVVASILVLSISLGAGQVYAASALDSNIITVISSNFRTIFNKYLTNTENELNNQATDVNSVKNQIDVKSKSSINDIENHKTNEVKRSQDEINSYANGVNQGIDEAINKETVDVKNEISQKVNDKVKNTKDQMNKDIEAILQSNLK